MPKISVKLSSYRAKKGFTLVELMVSIGIIVLIGAVSLPAFRNFSNNQKLEDSISDLKNTLRIAQSKAVSSISCSITKPSTKWVVRITSLTSYQLIPYCDQGGGTVSQDVIVTTTNLPPGISFSSLSPGCTAPPLTQANTENTDISFQGRNITITCNSGLPASSLTITLSNSVNSNTKKILITTGGIIGD